MKKTIYFRACTDRGRHYFQAGSGYLINFYNGAGAVDLVFGKNAGGYWSITEFSTGHLVTIDAYRTRAGAIASITSEFLKKILEKINDPALQAARDRLSAYRSENQ